MNSEKVENNMKKVCTTIWGLLICCLVCLVTNFFANEIFVKNYEAGTYKENKLSALGFWEPYIAYYNEGNLCYQKGNYETAIQAYETALSRYPSKQRECNIRINLALSMIAPIDSSQLTGQELEQAIATLEEAKEILCEQGCAAEDGNGHSKDAQTLKEDIDRFLEKLKNKQNAESKNSNKSNDPKKDTDNEQPLENKDTIEEQLKDIQRQSNEERNQSLSETDEFANYEFYMGQNW